MAKIQLTQTQSEFNKLNKAALQALFSEVTGEASANEVTVAQLKEAILEVAEVAPPAPPKQQPVAENEFEFEGKVYKTVLHAVHVPGLGHRTAGEIALDVDAQKYLVENCVGSVIVEVL